MKKIQAKIKTTAQKHFYHARCLHRIITVTAVQAIIRTLDKCLYIL